MGFVLKRLTGSQGNAVRLYYPLLQLNTGTNVAMVQGAHVLITRPSGQHEQFSQACKALGFVVSHLPCLAIEGIANRSLRGDIIAQANSVLFTSQNAVEHAHAQLPLPWAGVAIHAIGPATAKALRSKGQTLASEPNAPFNSDAFLTQISTHPPERLIIIKGQGGRTLISETLMLAGWHVHTLDVYKRRQPEISPVLVNDIFRTSVPDIVSVSSNETLSNLITLVGSNQASLLRLPLVVNSERCAVLAVQLGFQHRALIAQPVGDQGQLRQLKLWLQNTLADPIN